MNLEFLNKYYSANKFRSFSVYGEFIDPIFDRTYDDIIQLIELLDKGYDQFTEDEKELWGSDLKGALNASDLNRIENNMYLLSKSLGIDIVKKSWTELEIPTKDDFERIASNCKNIRETISALNVSTPDAPDIPLNNYQKINDIEKIIFDIYNIINANFYYYCRSDAELYCGEDGL